MTLNWVIAGGGTGGHVTPALALGEIIAERQEPILFIGSNQGLEARLVPEAGFELLALPSQQVMGRRLVGRLKGLWGTLRQVGRARSALRAHQTDIVISVGGFAAIPAALAALSLGRPLALLEPNAIPGRANRLTARFARRVFVGFASTAKHLHTRNPVSHFGIPLRGALLKAFDEAGPRTTAHSPLRLLVFGGSQGARQINETMMEIAPQFAGQPLEIFHQAGSADRQRVRAAYAEAGIQAEVVEFEPSMPTRYRWADLALCRAGALTVAELALAGLPALLVPYPFAADDHQAANADALAAAGAGIRLDSRPLNSAALATQLKALIRDPSPLAPMSAAASAFAQPDAARRIVETCAALVEAQEGPA
ncbi:MAG TPA: undecaprenyldiphospho-muramoylpentapeptide beta-N-acetylglucosaminyltransferase [Myxococcales bacterium]|nr:undecaprenyldiphospho-muramoylpentapeptide beta-N-acetylglucosaminyltransferase [Myxococcales bacterium]